MILHDLLYMAWIASDMPVGKTPDEFYQQPWPQKEFDDLIKDPNSTEEQLNNLVMSLYLKFLKRKVKRSR